MAEQSRPDLCIIGAGALGIALAKYARQLGASVVLVDRGVVEPGDGPDAAIRLAALKASAAHAQALRTGAAMGFADTEPKVSLKAIQERLSRLVADRAPLDSSERLAALGIEVVAGEPRFGDGQTVLVGEHRIRAGSVVIAIGALLQVPPIPGLDEIEIFTPDSVLEATRKLSHLLIIGGDASAYVLGQAFARLGSKVTLVPQGPALDGYDSETASLLIRTLKSEGVRIADGATVSAIHPRSQGIGATIALSNGESEALDVSHVLVANEGFADLATLDLGAAKLRPARNGKSLVHGELGQTSNRRVRLVGVSAGIGQWQHALRHGRAVVESLLLGAPRQKLAAQPRLIATEPALAEIGQMPKQNAKSARDQRIFRASLAENEWAMASGHAQGLIKVIATANGAIEGATIFGPLGAELSAVLALAMERGIALDALADLSLPHPSLFSTITTLGENYVAAKPVSSWTARRRALRRVIPL